MPPDDPLGRHGPSLDNFLRKRPIAPDHPPQQCPYGKEKCTYGNKCKYFHPERSTNQKSISDELKERDKIRKRDQFMNAILEGYKSQESPLDRGVAMHHGYHTEPLPRQRSVDHHGDSTPGRLPTSKALAEAAYRPRMPAEAVYNRSHGCHTEPLPRQRSIDHGDPQLASEKASYRSEESPHRASTFQAVHPPPHVHSTAKGYYTTEPIPQGGAIHMEGSHGTVPLAHVPPHIGAHSTRHSSLPSDPRGAAVGGGMFGDIDAEMAKLAIGGGSAVQDTR